MQAERFDTLSRLIGARTSRRMAVGLAATGLLSLAIPEAAAARCSTRKPCPDCRKCRKHRCKPDATQNGATLHRGRHLRERDLLPGPAGELHRRRAVLPGRGGDGVRADRQPRPDQCCRPLGGACSTAGSFEECCTVLLDGGGGRLVDCAPTNTCGGWGASCIVSSMCASGVCCRGSVGGFEGLCCNAGQFCVNHQCVG